MILIAGCGYLGSYLIDADTCIECGACASTCPVEAPAAE